MKRFFLLCSGVDLDLIQNCSNGEQNKYAGIGATVFFTALMATIASSYALYTVFENIYTSIFFGLVWGLLIFNLDRYIVSTLRKKNSFGKEFLQAFPRLLLAIIIAVVISKPLELKIFEKEINQVLLTEQNQMTLDNKNQIAQQFTPQIKKLETEISNLKAEIDQKEQETNQLYETYIAEAEGRKGTKLKGKGPVYKEKREKHDASLAQLSELKKANNEKIASKETEIATLLQQQKNSETNAQPIIANYDGLMARINALNKLPALPSLFIFLLFLAIETSPIFTKLISSKSEYDYKLENSESEIKSWIVQQNNQREKIVDTDKHINAEVYNDLKTEEELYNYKQKMAQNLMKLQGDSFFENQKRLL
ncbi:DUF4407 domain-containing protein [uncultured Tenacibaculum sp.]|uniref:DUF4407 domain-containing protein n=1 Tax=uncultured Tenacibaculum sp. TaxID=174713 RepID=UPI0026172878|nr:DUF4407 domain-containing protein [uncultured Tenacibaculum sp.]